MDRRLLLASGAYIDLSEYLLKSEAETLYAPLDAILNKQDKLISGTNIKTINGNSLLGGGDITISGGESNKICVLEIVTNYDLALEDTGIFSISPTEFNNMVANKYIFFIAMKRFGANTILPTCVSERDITAYCRTTTYSFVLTKNYDTNDITWKVTEKLNIDEKQDMLISGVNIRTINNMPILGIGNIDINTGGEGTGVYLTPFTVYEFCTQYIELTDEQKSELCSAAQQNKIICMPYGASTGYIVTDYTYQLSDATLDN